MRATDGLQTTITCRPVNVVDQTFSLATVAGDLLAHAAPGGASPRPDRGLRPSGRARSPTPTLPGPHREGRPGTGPPERHGKGGGGIQRRGTRPFTFKTIFGEVSVHGSRISHNRDGTIEIPSAVAWDTSHQLMITGNLRDAVCDQMGDQSARAGPRRRLSNPPGTRICWDRARSSTSCIRRGST